MYKKFTLENLEKALKEFDPPTITPVNDNFYILQYKDFVIGMNRRAMYELDRKLRESVKLC
jgi:hypothetical protein